MVSEEEEEEEVELLVTMSLKLVFDIVELEVVEPPEAVFVNKFVTVEPVKAVLVTLELAIGLAMTEL